MTLRGFSSFILLFCSIARAAEIQPATQSAQVLLQRIALQAETNDYAQTKANWLKSILKTSHEIDRQPRFANLYASLSSVLDSMKVIDDLIRASPGLNVPGTIYQQLQWVKLSVKDASESLDQEKAYLNDLPFRYHALNFSQTLQASRIAEFTVQHARNFISPQIEHALIVDALKTLAGRISNTPEALLFAPTLSYLKNETDERSGSSRKNDFFYVNDLKNLYLVYKTSRSEIQSIIDSEVKREKDLLNAMILSHSEEMKKAIDKVLFYISTSDRIQTLSLGTCTVAHRSFQWAHDSPDDSSTVTNSSGTYSVRALVKTTVTSYSFSGNIQTANGTDMGQLPSLNFDFLSECKGERKVLADTSSSIRRHLENAFTTFFSSDYRLYQKCFE